MKTGDKRQAAILAIVALLAVAFLAVRLMSSGPPPARVVQASSALSQAQPPPVGDLPLMVIGNPFSHSRLAPRRVIDPGGQRPVSVSGIIGLPEINGGIQIRPEGGTPEAENPEENAGSGQQVEQAPSQLALSAILRVEQPVALISLNGADSKSFASGDLVARGIRVIEIGSDFVVVRVGSKTHRLKPGSSLSLTQGVAS